LNLICVKSIGHNSLRNCALYVIMVA
jgi:hypothetical protein